MPRYQGNKAGWDGSERTMPFGKHTGEAIADIPTDYLLWAIDNVTFTNLNLKNSILRELEDRGEEVHYTQEKQEDFKHKQRQSREEWRGVREEVSKLTLQNVMHEIVNAGYRQLAIKHHPDTGGKTQDMQNVNLAMEELRRLLPKPK